MRCQQKKAIFTLIELVVLHNVPITKLRDLEFTKHLNIEYVSYITFIDALLQLVCVVEETISQETKDNKGFILYGGWSWFERHYMALMAAYFITKKDPNGKEFN